MINNFKQIKELLDFPDDDCFYFCSIIQRKKDNPNTSGTNNSARLIKAYYIKSIEHLEKLEGEMVLLANYYNARVGINLNKKSFEKIAFQTLMKITDQLMNKDFKSVRGAYNSACGDHYGSDKKWLIDIDSKDDYRFYVAEKIRRYNPEPGESKVLTYIPSKSGWHIITKPFDTTNFRKDCEMNGIAPEIHKNNPTNLYIP